MNIYQSEFLSISRQGDTLIQSWTETQLSIEDYQRELMHFVDLLGRVRPGEIIADIKKCSLILPESLDQWMAEKVLIPIRKKGIKKMGVTIAENSAVHLSIATSLEKGKPIIQSRYYADVNEARMHPNERESAPSSGLTLALSPRSNSVEVKLKLDVNDLSGFLRAIQQLESDDQFMRAHQERYYSLTLREIEVFRLIALGNTNKEIASRLFIEESSVKTHRKNIKQKLKITSQFDVYQYARSFQLI